MATTKPPPPPTGDLVDQEQVAEMVRRFYADVAQDDLLGPMFNEVAKVDWSAHLPKLTAFWCRFLFGTPGYAGNPFREHSLVHQQRPFTAAHFHRWLDLFEETVDLGWFGPNAERVKQLGRNVAEVHSGQLLGETIDVGCPHGAAPGPDLDSREHIGRLVRDFYREVSRDDRLGPIFNRVAEVDWTAHLDLMTGYWCRILLRESSYQGHIQAPHEAVHAKHELEAADFTRWYSLWTATIDTTYAGPKADQAKRHAANIATMLARRVAGVTWSPQTTAEDPAPIKGRTT